MLEINLFFKDSINTEKFWEGLEEFLIEKEALITGDSIYYCGSGKRERLPINEFKLDLFLDQEITEQGDVFEEIIDTVGFSKTNTGIAEFFLQDTSITLVLIYNDLAFVPSAGRWLWANSISFQIECDNENREFRQSCEELFCSACDYLEPAYARFHDSDEFRSKNIVSSPSVMAVGVDVSRYLPGLYYGNYFGEPFTNLLGVETILACESARHVELVGGIALFISDDVSNWMDDAYKDLERTTMEVLGTNYFYSSDSKNINTIGLDTQMPPLPKNPRFT